MEKQAFQTAKSFVTIGSKICFFFSLSVVKTRLFEMRNYAALTLITSVVPRPADIPLVRK